MRFNVSSDKLHHCFKTLVNAAVDRSVFISQGALLCNHSW